MKNFSFHNWCYKLTWMLLGLFSLVNPCGAAVMHVAPSETIFIEFGTFFDPVLFDLDGNGTEDLGLGRHGTQTSSTPYNWTRFVADLEGSPFNAALLSGDFIGASLNEPLAWDNEQQVINACASGGGGVVCFGNFDGGNDYLGIEFQISGATHYAWMQILSGEGFTGAIVIAWAWESEPGVGIVAGQIPEPSGALLVLVGLGAGLLRRRRGA